MNCLLTFSDSSDSLRVVSECAKLNKSHESFLDSYGAQKGRGVPDPNEENHDAGGRLRHRYHISLGPTGPKIRCVRLLFNRLTIRGPTQAMLS